MSQCLRPPSARRCGEVHNGNKPGHALYVPGDRSEDWQKLKLENQQEFIIGGYRWSPEARGVARYALGQKGA
jgi:hypothetical protein